MVHHTFDHHYFRLYLAQTSNDNASADGDEKLCAKDFAILQTKINRLHMEDEPAPAPYNGRT